MLATSSPFSQYYDNDGSPLKSGYVYFGVAGQNPETNPVTVYWDLAGTQPAAQPIRTLNGIPARNGTPAQVYAAADYSITVRNRLKRLIFTLSSASIFSAIQQLRNDLASTASATLGAGMVGYNSALAYGAGTVGKELQDLAAAGIMSVTDFGAIGTADDTAVLNLALAAATAARCMLRFPAGTYTITPVTIPSNIAMLWEPGVTVMAKAGFAVNDRLLNFVDCTNVTLFANGGQAKMRKADYVVGEQRHAVFITGATDVRIYDLNAVDSGGDGFYIGRTGGAGTHCVRIHLINCQGINNRRQGLSVVSCDTGNILNCTFRDTIGTPPAYGIDVEPNDSLDVIRSIKITNVKTSGNQGGGIIVALQALGATAANECGVEVTGWFSDGDGDSAPNTANAGLRVTGNGTGAWAFPIRGLVKISNFVIRNPKSSGIWCTYWQASNTPTLIIEDGVIINPGSASPVNSEDQCGAVIWGYNLGAQDFGNIDINRVKVRDTRGVAATYSPVYVFKTLGATGVGQARNVKLRDVLGDGFTPTSGRGHVLTIVDMDQSSITYTDEQRVTNIANSADITRGYAGYNIVGTVSGVMTVPKASTNRGLSYRFSNEAAGQNIQVRPTAGDSLDFTTTLPNIDLVLSLYSAFVQFKATENNFYRAEAIHPYANRPGATITPELTAPPLAQVWVTAMPTNGLWKRGDIAWNINFAIGSPPFWARISTGSGNVINVDWRAAPNL